MGRYRVTLAKTTIGFCVGALAYFGALKQGRACGLEVDVPKNHFDGVNEVGHLSYWDNIGELDLGEGDILPLVINFRSSRQTISPYLGKGWILAPLDSTFVQVEENRFMMLQPNGSWTYFTRSKSTDTVLYGQGTWMAEIKGDVITAWPNCGGKMVFNRGKLVSISTKRHTADFVYTGNKVSEIRQAGSTILKVLWNESDGELAGLEFGAKRLVTSQGAMPRVETIAGKNLVGGIDRSLVELARGESDKIKFEYGVDDELRPTFTVGARKMIWDPATKIIISDGLWKYCITPISGMRSPLEIARSNGKSRESWIYDTIGGKEVTGYQDGVTQIKKWFTSGVMAGKVRSISNIINNKTFNAYRAVYNERGNLINEYIADGESGRLLTYNENGKLTSSKGNKTVGVDYIFSSSKDFVPSIIKYTSEKAIIAFELDKEGKIAGVASDYSSPYKNFKK